MRKLTTMSTWTITTSARIFRQTNAPLEWNMLKICWTIRCGTGAGFLVITILETQGKIYHDLSNKKNSSISTYKPVSWVHSSNLQFHLKMNNKSIELNPRNSELRRKTPGRNKEGSVRHCLVSLWMTAYGRQALQSFPTMHTWLFSSRLHMFWQNPTEFGKGSSHRFIGINVMAGHLPIALRRSNGGGRCFGAKNQPWSESCRESSCEIFDLLLLSEYFAIN